MKLVLAFLAFLIPTLAHAQWQVPNHSVPTGRGGGTTGFGSVGPCTAGIPLVGAGANADPACAQLGISGGGTGAGTQAGAATSILPPATAAGQTVRWNGSQWVPALLSTISGGRVTPQTGVPLQAADGSHDFVNASQVFYDAFKSNLVNIGGTMYALTGELSLTLGNYVTAGNVYGVFMICNGAPCVPTLCVGPAWSTPPIFGTTIGVESSAGSTGVNYLLGGTTVNTNAVPMACKFGSGAGTTINIAQYAATEVAMIYGSGTGTYSVQFRPAAAAGGSLPVVGMCNVDNQEPMTVFEESSTSSFINNQPAVEFQELSVNNSIIFLQCPNPHVVNAVYDASQSYDISGGAQAVTLGVGIDVSAPAFNTANGAGAYLGQVANTLSGNGGMLYGGSHFLPAPGLHRVSACEQSTPVATFLFYHDFASLQYQGFY